MTTIEKLNASMASCPCCGGTPELCVEGMVPTEVFVRCRTCRLSTRRRRTASVTYPLKGMVGTMEERLDAGERRQKLRLAFRAIADWNRRPDPSAAPGKRAASRPPTAPGSPQVAEASALRWSQRGFALISDGPGHHPMLQEFRCGRGEIDQAEKTLRQTIPEKFHPTLLKDLVAVEATLEFCWTPITP